MKTYYLLCLSVLIFSCTKTAENQTTNTDLPNIIHIFADDLGYGDLGCFGATDIKTPNIDRIAAEGIKFTSFYSAAHVCSPSRAALLTGRYPQRMGIHGVFFPESFTGMPSEEVTIAEMLKPLGYKTGIVGKWHLGHMHKYLPLQQGFDSYFGIPYSNDMESVVYMRGNDAVDFDVDQRYTTKTYTVEALQFIDQNKEDPFFLYLPHSMPHVPIYASEDFLGTSDRGLYGDVIQELDWSVGQVLSKLEEHGLLDNTLVIFSSDNGPWTVMKDHGGSTGGLRGGKQFTFEGGMRVPTVAMWKNKVPGGQVYDQLATQMDWFPTIANITGATMPDQPIDGLDITAVLTGEGERSNNEFVYFDGGKAEAYRKGDWKVKLPFKGSPGSPWRDKFEAHDTLLVNLAEDMASANNLYSESEELGLKMIEEMKTSHAAMGELPPAQVIRTKDDKSHLEYLGHSIKQVVEKKNQRQSESNGLYTDNNFGCATWEHTVVQSHAVIRFACAQQNQQLNIH